MFPTGIATRDIKVGPAFDLVSGAPLSIRVMVSPSRPLVWAATGDPVMPRLKTYNFPAEEQGILELPVTNQTGFKTTAGQFVTVGPALHALSYKIQVFYFLNGSQIKRTPDKSVVLSAGAPLDIDDLVVYSPSNDGPIISAPNEILQLAQQAADNALAAANSADTAADSAADAAASLADINTNMPTVVDGILNEWVEDQDLPTVRTGLNVQGWPNFVVLERNASSSSIPNGTFIVRLPEGFTP